MAGFITRMRSSLSKLKRQGVISSIQKFACTLNAKKGVRLAAMAAGTAYLANQAIKESKDNTEKEEVFDKNIYNIEEFVKKKARELHAIDGKRSFFRKEHITVDWDGVTFHPEAINYSRILTPELQNDLYKVYFQTVFKNNSYIVQEHNLKTERKIHYNRECSVSVGFSISSNVKLRIPIPTSATENFSAGIMIKNPKGNSEEKTDTWIIEDLIKIPKRSHIDVTVTTKEVKQDYEFKSWVGFTGNVDAIIYSKDKKIIRTISMPIGEIIKKEIPEKMRRKDKDNDDKYYIKIKGTVKYSHDVEHDTCITYR